MSDLRKNLIGEFRDPDYRYAYAESFLNTKIATQIKTLREQRGKKQAELGAVVGTKQSGFSRFEDVNHPVWKTDTLWKIARALDVRVNISFETFGSLIEDKEHFNKESLQRPDFEHDPAFKNVESEKRREPDRETVLAARIPTPPSGETTRQEPSNVIPIDQSIRYGSLGPVRKLLKQLEVLLFYTLGSEPRGHSAALPLFVGLLGRTDAAFSGSRRERCHRIRRRIRSRTCDGRVTPSDHRRIKGTASAEGVARGLAGAVPNSAEGRRTKKNR